MHPGDVCLARDRLVGRHGTCRDDQCLRRRRDVVGIVVRFVMTWDDRRLPGADGGTVSDGGVETEADED